MNASRQIVAYSNETHELTGKGLIINLTHTPQAKSLLEPALLSNKQVSLIAHFEKLHGFGSLPLINVSLNGNEYQLGALALYGLSESSTAGLEHDGHGQQHLLEYQDVPSTLLADLLNTNKPNYITLSLERPLAPDASLSIGRVTLSLA